MSPPAFRPPLLMGSDVAAPASAVPSPVLAPSLAGADSFMVDDPLTIEDDDGPAGGVLGASLPAAAAVAATPQKKFTLARLLKRRPSAGTLALDGGLDASASSFSTSPRSSISSRGPAAKLRALVPSLRNNSNTNMAPAAPMETTKSSSSSSSSSSSVPGANDPLPPPPPPVPVGKERNRLGSFSLPTRRRRASFHGMYAAHAAAVAAEQVGAVPWPKPGSEGEVYSNELDDYEILDTIGYGASAHVVLATYRATDAPVALKVVDLDRFERCQIEELRKEIQVMSLCRHPHLVPVYRSFVAADNHLYLVMPLRTAGSINAVMKHAFPKGLPEVAIATVLRQVLLGVQYLHQHGLIHRDLKGANLMLDRETGLVQLGDFGVSSSLCEGVHRKTRRSFVGSLLWMAPEVMEQSGAGGDTVGTGGVGYNTKADIYSLGITVLEMAYGRAPYAEYPPLKVCLLVLNNPPPTLNRQATHFKYSRSLKDLVDACLMRSPALRPSADRLLQMAFLKRARKPEFLVKALDLLGMPPLTARRPEIDPLGNNRIDATVSSMWDFDPLPPAAAAGGNAEDVDLDGSSDSADGDVSPGVRVHWCDEPILPVASVDEEVSLGGGSPPPEPAVTPRRHPPERVPSLPWVDMFSASV
ncbi:hypothetical protein GGF32_007601 [Allomyces javanicus]|nr:hypothetical protein GGF32_007601 [Allomyces javanicus]